MNKKEYDRQRYLANKDKLSAQAKAWKERNPARVKNYKRNWEFQKKYGITTEEYERQWALQDRRCKICNTSDAGKKGFHVDHDHINGKFRGILCGNCNNALGLFQESTQILNSAMEYLCASMS